MDNNGLNGVGIIFMTFSWMSIIALNVFCFKNIFREQKDKIVGPLEVEVEMDEEIKGT